MTQTDPQTPPEDDVAVQVKPFAAFLQEQRKGSLHTELSDGLADLVRLCQEHGKTGTATLKLTVKPQKDGETLQITDDVKFAPPKGERPASTFFADETGNLSRNPPRQQELPLREVGDGRADTPLRKAQ